MKVTAFVIVPPDSVTMANETINGETVLNRTLLNVYNIRHEPDVFTVVKPKTTSLRSMAPFVIVADNNNFATLGKNLKDHIVPETDYVMFVDGLAPMLQTASMEACLEKATKEMDVCTSVETLPVSYMSHTSPLYVPHCLVRHVSAVGKPLRLQGVLISYSEAIRVSQYQDLATVRQIIETNELMEG